MLSTTFGFEAEFSTDVGTLTRALHDADLCYMEAPHRYHCGDDCCAFDDEDGNPLRVQTDSSCGGEVISNILHTDAWGHATALMGDVCARAIDTDTEPGLNAGLHVHVAHGHLTDAHRQDVFWQFARWERTLSFIGAGRWLRNRNVNSRVRQSITNATNVYVTEDDGWFEGTDGLPDSAGRTDLAELIQYHRDNDRHSNLNLRTNHPTMEFRLWNSTRSPWRMALFCGLSVAFMDPAVLTLIGETEVLPDPNSVSDAERRARPLAPDFYERLDAYGDQPDYDVIGRNARALLDCLDRSEGYGDITPLLERQTEYLLAGVDAPPPLLLTTV